MASPRFSIRLIIFITISLLLQFVIIVLRAKHIARQTVVSKAAETSSASFGFNIHSLPLLAPNEVSQTLSMVSQCGNTGLIRFWGFSGGDNIGKVLDNAPANMRFVVTLSNFYNSGVNQPWPAPQGNETAWFSSEWKTNGYRDFIDQVSKKYANNPKILIWELMNEPSCTAEEACTKAQHEFFREASAIIYENSPQTLISPGTLAQGTGGEHFENGDFEDIANISTITALSCHIQVDDSSLAISKANCVTALQIAKKFNKFFYTGEFGENLHCTEGCVNTCTTEQLQQRKDEILSVTNELNSLGNNATIVWQFSPERNPTLSCDGSSVFPKDPFCSITGETTLTQQQNQTGSTTGGFSFSPQSPVEGDSLRVTFTASRGLVWVNLAGTGPNGEKINMAGKTPGISRDSKGFHWTYTVENVKVGIYSFVFSDNCNLYNTKGQPLADICHQVGTGSITVAGEKNPQVPERTTTTTKPAPNVPQGTTGTGQVTFLKEDLNKIAGTGAIDFQTAQYCYPTSSGRTCQPGHVSVTNDTITIGYPKSSSVQGFCFNLIRSSGVSMMCL